MEKRINNVVGSVKLGFPVNLESMHHECKKLGYITEYTPEVFPGMIVKRYIPEKTKPISIIIFSNGKSIISGARSIEEFNEVAEWLNSVAANHRFVPA